MSKRQHELEVKREMEGCVHFRGIQHATCKAGINTRELVGGDIFGWAMRMPCLIGDDRKSDVVCPSAKFPTREEAEAAVKEHNEQLEKTTAAVRAAHADAKAKGLRQGNGGVSSMPCPLGCGGKLKYSVAGVNGHMHAACENGCAAWME